ncbi:MAG: alpha/beta hydrolase [Suilimivivens sp.]
MKVFLAILLLIIMGISFMYYLYRLVFCYPLKKRPDVHQIPESDLYKEYRDVMAASVNDMEKTPHENIGICSFDGCRLYGKLYKMKKDAPLILFFHGYHGMSAWDGYGLFNICKENGINILMVDERAHGKSEGNAITFGIKERYDCKLWTEYAVQLLGEETDIFLAGVSMGAASVMMATELGLPGNVKGIVADCGYSEPSEIIKETVRKLKFPVSPVYFLIKAGAHIFGRFNIEDASPLEAVKKLEIPILFIHGTQDSVVPVSMNEELYESCAGRKERVLIAGADHANSALADYETYRKAVIGFLKNL